MPSSLFNRSRIEKFFDINTYLKGGGNGKFFLHYGDLLDSSSIGKILNKVSPTEVYNLGAQSHVGVSFDVPEYTVESTGVGTLRLLEAIKTNNINCKIYQAGSSEMFGKIKDNPQTERTPFYPCSPYGISKVFSHWIAVNYRESYNMFISNGILFNHESPRRGENFVTRKITLGAASIKLGLQNELVLGNLDAERDWGYAKDFVEPMWLMLQQKNPDDFIIATGMTTQHLQSSSTEISKYLKDSNIKINHREGLSDSGWVLLDFPDLLIHLFLENQRENYDLESLWSKSSEILRISANSLAVLTNDIPFSPLNGLRFNFTGSRTVTMCNPAQ